jgi:hypothetical protein
MESCAAALLRRETEEEEEEEERGGIVVVVVRCRVASTLANNRSHCSSSRRLAMAHLGLK